MKMLVLLLFLMWWAFKKRLIRSHFWLLTAVCTSSNNESSGWIYGDSTGGVSWQAVLGFSCGILLKMITILLVVIFSWFSWSPMCFEAIRFLKNQYIKLDIVLRGVKGTVLILEKNALAFLFFFSFLATYLICEHLSRALVCFLSSDSGKKGE